MYNRWGSLDIHSDWNDWEKNSWAGYSVSYQLPEYNCCLSCRVDPSHMLLNPVKTFDKQTKNQGYPCTYHSVTLRISRERDIKEIFGQTN